MCLHSAPLQPRARQPHDHYPFKVEFWRRTCPSQIIFQALNKPPINYQYCLKAFPHQMSMHSKPIPEKKKGNVKKTSFLKTIFKY